MLVRYFKIILTILFCIALSPDKVIAQDVVHQEHIEVSLRMIGHNILLQSGDSTSRILPIEKEGDKYKITFESDFMFQPEDLNSTFDSIVRKTNIAERYIVEVEDCIEKQIFYSFEIGETFDKDIIPCRGRELPKSCYSIFFTILDSSTLLKENEPKFIEHNKQFDIFLYLLVLTPLIVVFGMFFKQKKKQNLSKKNSNLISIGNYLFDTRNMKLILKEQQTELTSKEADLLQVLYENVNSTIERETILKVVWGDEGDYIGRTLDVYISKLRKKLESDPRIKIMNVRGIGYKLILDL